jgi:hypothetical protein
VRKFPYNTESHHDLSFCSQPRARVCIQRPYWTRPRAILFVIPSCSCRSSELAGATRLKQIHLGLREGQLLEARGQLGAVEEQALACLNGTEVLARRTTDVTANQGAGSGVQGTVLLCLLAVCLEGVGKLVGGRRWVRVRGVVNLCDRC